MENTAYGEYAGRQRVMAPKSTARTGKQIKAEIEKRFGFFPPFFEPALKTPAVLENLWQQTLSAYVNNPIPNLFKERLFAYLSRYCSIPYCIVCHSCALRPLGMKAEEVLKLIQEPGPAGEVDIKKHLKKLSSTKGSLPAWPEPDSLIEKALFNCSVLMFLHPARCGRCRKELRRLLSPKYYTHLVEFLGYIKTCHLWVEAHPELSYKADKRTKEHLKPLLDAAPGLATFFKNYDESLMDERRMQEEHLAEELDALQQAQKTLLESGEHLQTLNRMFKMLTECNEVLVRADDEKELLNKICNIIIESGGYRLVWVGFAKNDEYKSVQPVAQAGYEEGYLETANITWADRARGKGPTGTAIRTGKTTVCKNVLTTPNFAPWRDEAVKRGYESSIAIPLIKNSRPFGTLNIYAAKPDAFHDEEVKLLEELANDMAYGITAFQIRAEHKQMDDENRLLKDIILSIADAEDMDSAMTVAIKKICETTRWDCGEAWVPSHDGKSLVYGKAFYCVKNTKEINIFRKISEGFVFEPGMGLPGQVWSSKMPKWLTDVSVNGNEYLRAKEALAAGLRAGLGVPIITDGDVLAVLVFYMSEPKAAEERLVSLVKAVASQLGSVVKRRKIEEDLREGEERFKATFEQAAVGIAHVRPDGKWLMVNQRLCDIVGYTKEELYKLTFQDITHPDDLETDLEYLQKMLAGKINIYSMEKRYFHKDGSIVWINLTVSLVHGPDNAPKYFISVIEDISRRKQAEEEKKKVEAQLRHMQKMEAVGQLAGGIAHDFNNMLTAIIGNATLLQMKISEDVKLRHYTDEIVASSERAANLTRGLLAFSRKQMLDVKPVPLNSIIKGVEKLISRLIGEDIELKVLSAKKDIIVRADAGQIEQVIMNLATNARDAMPNGGDLTIITEVINLDNEFVKAHGYGKPGAYALLSVSDTGMGMDEDVKQKIFEPFFTTKELGKGTGLGLSIVYGIIKQHEGYINVYSEPNKGTTFRIYLPVIEIGIGAAELTKKAVEPERGTETVLLAEDEANVRRFVKTVLEEFGYTVIEAVDGEDAINKFQQNKEKIHLIILDVIMPRKSGREAYESIVSSAPDARFLFTSGYNEDIIHKKGILEEGLDFISKPFVPTGFLRKVRAVLDR